MKALATVLEQLLCIVFVKTICASLEVNKETLGDLPAVAVYTKPS